MKIIIVGAAFPFRGGIAHHTSLLYRELSKKHQVEIVTFTRQYPSLLFPGTTQREADGALVSVPSTQMIDSINPVSWIRAGRWIREQSPDLVIFPYSMPFFAPCFGTIAALARRNKKTRVLFLCHNIIPHERHIGDIALTKYAFSRGDYFVVQSKEVQRDLLTLFPDARHALSPHPIYDMFGTALPKNEARRKLNITTKNVLLFFGYIRKYKGVHVLLDAMRSVVQKLPDATLLIVGEFYGDEDAYRKQISDSAIGSVVKIVSHYIPQDEVALYFSAADVVVLPYLSATQSGIVQIAYNFNKPIIASRVGGLGEIVAEGKTGLVVDPNDAGALADAIIDFYEQQRESEFVKNVVAEKGKFSWENMCRTIEQLVERSNN
jgi:glycosyltransferase involved in cell wall biosynthesis